MCSTHQAPFSCYSLSFHTLTDFLSDLREDHHGRVLDEFGLPSNYDVISDAKDGCRLHLILYEVSGIGADGPQIGLGRQFLQLFSCIASQIPILLRGRLKLTMRSISVSFLRADFSNVFWTTSILIMIISTIKFVILYCTLLPNSTGTRFYIGLKLFH